MTKPTHPSIDTTPYLNRWIALVQQRVVGVGITPEQARRAAQRSRPKEAAALLYVNTDGELLAEAPTFQPESWLDDHPILRQAINYLQAQQLEAYLVGGAVRDLLLGRTAISDYDFAVPGDGLRVARQVAKALGLAFYPLDEARKTGRAIHTAPTGKQTYLDFATFRGATLVEDLADRDFTLNAIALRLTEPPGLIDPLNGAVDLAQRQIKAATANSFAHDPVRVLRAVRQAVQFGFVIDAHTQQYLQQAVPLLKQVSVERQRDELIKLLNTAQPGQAVQMLHQLAVLPRLLPEVEATVGVAQSPPHHLPVFEHTALALNSWAAQRRRGFELGDDDESDFAEAVAAYLAERLSGNLTIGEVLPLALLLHDVGKPLTRSEEVIDEQSRIRFLGHEQESRKLARRRLKRLHFSSQIIDFVGTVVAQHMRPLHLANERTLTRRAVYRYFRDTGGAGFHAGIATALHALIDHDATYPPGEGQAERAKLEVIVKKLLMAYFARREEVIDPPPLLTGRDLIDRFKLSEGRLIGDLLRRLKEEQASGRVTTQAEAIEFIKNALDFAHQQPDNL